MGDQTVQPRSRAERIADTLEKLIHEIDCWVASSSATADAYLVPLWFVWVNGQVVLATAGATRTARNLRRAGRIRLGLASATDVVIVDGTVEVIATSTADEGLAAAFATRTGWDPRSEPAEYVYVVVSPQRIQAWRGVQEIPDRLIMDNGSWL